jgi:hypothetical protein
MGNLEQPVAITGVGLDLKDITKNSPATNSGQAAVYGSLTEWQDSFG